MKKRNEIYLEAFMSATEPTTVDELVQYIDKNYPDFVKAKDEAARAHKTPISGYNQIKNELNSAITQNQIPPQIEVDRTTKPITVQFIEVNEEIEEQIEQVVSSRASRISASSETLSQDEAYKISEFELIRKGFKEYCGLIFEVDHAKALCNQDDPGEHHPGNLQLLIPSTNRAKGAKNWKRLSWEEQEQYIRLQKEASSVLNSFDEEMEKVFNLLLQRLQVIYSI